LTPKLLPVVLSDGRASKTNMDLNNDFLLGRDFVEVFQASLDNNAATLDKESESESSGGDRSTSTELQMQRGMILCLCLVGVWVVMATLHAREST
jgi:hypothetical protein